MHIVEKISKNFGVEPLKSPPNLDTSILPLSFDKYITIINDKTIEKNYYDFFQDVISNIKNELKNESINIIEILLNPNQKPLDGVISFSNISKSQTNYLIKHSMVHICNDPYSIQVAGIFDKKCMFISPNKRFCNISAYYGSNCENLFGKNNDNKKEINEIDSESISQFILKSLNIDPLEKFETIFKGEFYNSIYSCNIIPDFQSDKVIDKKFKEMYLRLDLHNDEKNASTFLYKNKCHLVCKNQPTEKFLSFFKNSIGSLIFYLNEYSNPENYKTAIKLGFDIKFIFDCTDLSNESIKNRLLYKFIDHSIIFLDFSKNKINCESEDSLYFRTNRYFLSKNKIFPSLYHANINEPLKINNKLYLSNHSKEDLNSFCVKKII